MTVNRRSRRVMEKVGMQLVRHYFEDWGDPIEGSESGDVEYAIGKAEWLRTREFPAP
jgi:RimJ/RimL family protein N-acetyltransferase